MKLAVVVPCYNEEEVLEETALRLLKLLDEMKNECIGDIYFVDDGSRDKTFAIIERLSCEHSNIHGIKLAKNVGHQNALLAGLFSVEADAIISIDADLQDDINCIKDMVKEFKSGSEVVYGVRKERKTDTKFKRVTAEGFYKLMKIMGVDIIYNHADYRLLSQRAINMLKDFREVNLFLRGIVPLIGLKSSVVYYDRLERFAGESKYPLKKMLSFAWDGITSFSIVPLRFITMIGFIIFILSIIVSFWVILIKLFTSNAVPGWASTVLPIYFIGGIQLFAIGIIGEYIGKIYKEVKDRPRYFIERVV